MNSEHISDFLIPRQMDHLKIIWLPVLPYDLLVVVDFNTYNIIVIKFLVAMLQCHWWLLLDLELESCCPYNDDPRPSLPAPPFRIPLSCALLTHITMTTVYETNNWKIV